MWFNIVISPHIRAGHLTGTKNLAINSHLIQGHVPYCSVAKWLLSTWSTGIPFYKSNGYGSDYQFELEGLHPLVTGNPCMYSI